MAPDEVFIRSLEGHLQWPVDETRDYIEAQYKEDPSFAGRVRRWLSEDLQWTVNPADAASWRAILDRAARTLCYIFCNRAISYDAIPRQVFEDRLPHYPPSPAGAAEERVDKHFRSPVRRSPERCNQRLRCPSSFPHLTIGLFACVRVARACSGWAGWLANLRIHVRALRTDWWDTSSSAYISPEEPRSSAILHASEEG
jgi:hypothetical protein